jgi:type I restriction enzyme, R subunit
MLYWFLKFLIPKLTIKDFLGDELDSLLESVDLSTYGLERVKLGQRIGLDPSASELEAPNPNPRSVHSGEEQKDPLNLIVSAFNER